MPSLLTIYTYLSILLPFVQCGTSREGDISLWSDSECNSKGTSKHFSEPDPIGLNFTLWPDYCGVPGAAVHSYRVNVNAVCVSGAPATFKYYNTENCTPDPTDENPMPSLRRRQMGGSGGFSTSDGMDLTGLCLGMTAFKSFAFICEGVDDSGFKTVLSSSPAPATSSSTSSTSSSASTTSSSTSAASSSTAPSSDGSSSTTSSSAAASTTSSDNVRVYTTSGPTVTVLQSQSSNPSSTPSSQPSAGAQSSESIGGASAGVSIGCAVGVVGAVILVLL